MNENKQQSLFEKVLFEKNSCFNSNSFKQTGY